MRDMYFVLALILWAAFCFLGSSLIKEAYFWYTVAKDFPDIREQYHNSFWYYFRCIRWG